MQQHYKPVFTDLHTYDSSKLAENFSPGAYIIYWRIALKIIMTRRTWWYHLHTQCLSLFPWFETQDPPFRFSKYAEMIMTSTNQGGVIITMFMRNMWHLNIPSLFSSPLLILSLNSVFCVGPHIVCLFGVKRYEAAAVSVLQLCLRYWTEQCGICSFC